VQTFEQQPRRPDAGQRALVARLADVARADGRRFAELVRRADDLLARDWDREAAYASALESTAEGSRP